MTVVDFPACGELILHGALTQYCVLNPVLVESFTFEIHFLAESLTFSLLTVFLRWTDTGGKSVREKIDLN